MKGSFKGQLIFDFEAVDTEGPIEIIELRAGIGGKIVDETTTALLEFFFRDELRLYATSLLREEEIAERKLRSQLDEQDS
jgi:hypothetical protein